MAWNEYMDAFMFISRQFWISREMKQMGILRLFEAMKMVPSTRATLQVMSALLGMFREKVRPGLEKSKNVAKTAKIECYNTPFRTFPEPELRTPRDAS